MKTNVNMVRKMGDFEVVQRTKDGMFNANELLKQWNKHSGQQKELKKFFENKATKEFIQTIENEEYLHTRNSVYVKSRASRGSNAGTWMHPLLFIDFAMWLNPTFKYHVLKFVHDQLIEFRHMAGDNYKSLSGSIAKLAQGNQENYKEIARMLNHIVFGKHESGIRQFASSQQLRELSVLQEKATFLIDMGYVNDMDDLKEAMRKVYKKKFDLS